MAGDASISYREHFVSIEPANAMHTQQVNHPLSLSSLSSLRDHAVEYVAEDIMGRGGEEEERKVVTAAEETSIHHHTGRKDGNRSISRNATRKPADSAGSDCARSGSRDLHATGRGRRRERERVFKVP